MTVLTAAQYTEKVMRSMTEAYSTFEIAKRSDDRFLIQGRYPDSAWKGEYTTEIIALWGHSRLFVGGDIDDTVFAYGPKEPIARIYWIGRHPQFDHYILEKASIGSQPNKVQDFDHDLAWIELAEHLELPLEEVKESLECEEECGQDAFIGAFYDSELGKNETDAFEWLGGIGMLPSIRVIQAYCACRRLCELLDQENP